MIILNKVDILIYQRNVPIGCKVYFRKGNDLSLFITIININM
jgi:hypothetical protein